MYIVGEESYCATNWYARILSPMKALARKKRVALTETADASAVEAGETCAFVIGGSVRWITEAVLTLQAHGVHPVVLSELPDGMPLGKCSRVRTDYYRFVLRLSGKGDTAFYGMNPRSMSDRARRDAFLAAIPAGEVFENDGSLEKCFAAFARRHAEAPFARVICANELAAASLVRHLKRTGGEMPTVAVHAAAELLSYFPEIRTSQVSPTSLCQAAFAIADTVRQNPDFLGMEITVEDADGVGDALPTLPVAAPAPDGFWEDREMNEWMRIEQLLAACDETDLTILRLLREERRDIGEEAYLSDNGVKYRIKKMKRICAVESKRDVVALLENYGIEV